MLLVQYFIGVLLTPNAPSEGVAKILEDAFGSFDLTSPLFQDYTPEKGEGHRIFFSLKKLHPASRLARFKEDAMLLEQEFFMKKGKRSVNLDPGYLDATKVVLASSKEGGHKIALTEKIYASLILDYTGETFRSFDWTPADFKSGKYFLFLNQMREQFLKKL